MSVYTLILRPSDSTNSIIIFLAIRTIALYITIVINLHIQTSLVEAVLAEEVDSWQRELRTAEGTARVVEGLGFGG